MKVVHLLAGDERGGAARGALWLHEALLSKGVESYVILQFGEVRDPVVHIVDNSYFKLKLQKLRRIFDQIPFRIYPKHKRYIFSPGIFGLDFTNNDLVKNADLVHLHWIANVFVDLRTLSQFNKPIIWTFRDMWPFTGGCHNSLECNNYKTGCGACPHLGSNRYNDLSRWLLRRKEKYYKNNFQPVAVSNWLKEAIESSYLFSKRKIHLIFNGLNTDIFRPVDFKAARVNLNLPSDKKIVLIEGQSTKHIWKGTNELKICIEHLKVEDYLYMFFGDTDKDFIKDLKADCISLGEINDDNRLAEIYSSSDVYLTPALQEPFGKTIIESMACGTPVACFNANGPKDIVDHKKSGYGAVPFDPVDLAEGVKWLISEKEHNNFGREAIDKVKRHFDINLITDQYIELYNSSLENFPFY